MSDALMKKVSGTKVFDQTLPQVLPIAAHPVAAVAQASATLLGTHRDSWPHTRLLQQVTARIRAKRLAQHQISHHAPKTALYRVPVTTKLCVSAPDVASYPRDGSERAVEGLGLQLLGVRQ